MVAQGRAKFLQKVRSKHPPDFLDDHIYEAENVTFFCRIAAYEKASSMSAELDRTDLKILRLLQNNGRLSNAALAEEVGLSPVTAGQNACSTPVLWARCGRW
jgi:AsnC-type helix-turn-helix domain